MQGPEVMGRQHWLFWLHSQEVHPGGQGDVGHWLHRIELGPWLPRAIRCGLQGYRTWLSLFLT